MRVIAVIVVTVLSVFVGLTIAGAFEGSARTQAAPATSVAERDVEPADARAHTRQPPQKEVAPSEPRRGKRYPSARAVGAARNFANARGEAVSFAVVDSSGRMHGLDERRRYSSASVVKALLLAAELRRLKQAGRPVDPETDRLLEAMITVSDNAAADTIYARVGDSGLFAVARRAGMRDYSVAGYWGNSLISAADMALMFADLDRSFPRRDREYAKGLLGSVAEEQSWGIPDAAGGRWAVRFKGGWLPDQALVHQAAELRERAGSRELAIVVLTDSQPSFDYGIGTVEGVASKLLSR